MKIWNLTAIGFAAMLFAVGCASDESPASPNDIGSGNKPIEQDENLPAIAIDTVGLALANTTRKFAKAA